MKKLLFITSFVLLLAPTISFAAITFTNGLWSTTFDTDCNEWLDWSAGSWTCAGINKPVNSPAGYGYCTCCATPPCDSGPATEPTQVTTDANYSSGGGGKGWRVWRSPGAIKNSPNNFVSSYLLIYLPPPRVKEIWIRYYARFETGMRLNVTGSDSFKMLYLYGDGTGHIAHPVLEAWNGAYSISALQHWDSSHPSGYQALDEDGVNRSWSNLFPSAISDESWHRFEFHFKMETFPTPSPLNDSTIDGVFQFWVDGHLVWNLSHVSYHDAGDSSWTGWDHIFIPHNGGVYGSDQSCIWTDFDDLAIATSDYTGFQTDAHGRPVIGPIGNPAPSPPKNLRIIP